MSFKSSDHSAVHHTLRTTRGAQLCCLLNAARKLYQEIFISIKQLHGNSRRAQGTHQPSYPLVFHYFWEDLNEEDIQSATCQTELSRLQRTESQSTSLNQQIDSPPNTNPISGWSRSSFFGLKCGSSSKYPEKCQLLSD